MDLLPPDAISEKYQAYIQRLVDQGLVLGAIRFSYAVGKGLFVKAACSIQAGQVLAVIPAQLCTLPSELFREKLDEFDRLVLAMAIKKKQECIESFINPHSCTKYYPADIKVLGCPALLAEYQRLCQKRIATLNGINEVRPDLVEQTGWAFDFCVSRCYLFAGKLMILPCADLFNSDDFGCYQATLQLTDHSDPSSLISCIGQQQDLTHFNEHCNLQFRQHAFKKALLTADYKQLGAFFQQDEEKQQMEEDLEGCTAILIVCGSRIPPGQEVFMSYGRLSNHQLICKYGYAVHDNRHEAVFLKKEKQMLVICLQQTAEYALSLRKLCPSLRLLTNAVPMLQQLRDRMPTQSTITIMQFKVFLQTRKRIVDRQISYLQFLKGQRNNQLQLCQGCRDFL